jgi:hypothetical protein
MPPAPAPLSKTPLSLLPYLPDVGKVVRMDGVPNAIGPTGNSSVFGGDLSKEIRILTSL